MKKILFAAAASLAALATTAPAHAADEGKWEVKVLGTAVLPDGKISEVKSIATSLSSMAAFASPQTKANDNYVPTVAIEYYFTPSVSLETICCTTKHHVDGRGSLAGTNLVNSVLIVPATFALKYHLPAGPVRPYVGAGPAFFWVLDKKPGTTATALGVTQVKMSSEIGAMVQAGVDIPVNAGGMGITLDAKKYWVSTNAHFLAGSSEVLVTRHKLDPWVLSGGVYFKF